MDKLQKRYKIGKYRLRNLINLFFKKLIILRKYFFFKIKLHLLFKIKLDRI